MEFTEFAQLLKPIIGGSYNTQIFTRTIFESIITDEGALQIEDISASTFKSYYNGKTKVTKIAQRVLPYLDPEQFISYLENYPEATSQRLLDCFKPYIDEITLHNATEKVAYLFEDILKEAASKKRNSTPKGATKTETKSASQRINDKILASGQAFTNAWSNVIENLADELDDSHPSKRQNSKLVVEALSNQDSAFLKQFRERAKPILKYCIDTDPAAEATDLFLNDKIADLLNEWKFEYREIEDAALRNIVKDTLNVLNEYTYYISDKFLRLIPNKKVLWFRNESWEEGEQLRNVLQPESYRLRCEMRDLYLRLYPLPEDENHATNIHLPENQSSAESPYSTEDDILLKDFVADYDELMLTLISENFGESLVDMSVQGRIQQLYNSKWKSKADKFLDPTLKSYVFGLLGELNKLNDSLLSHTNNMTSIKSIRTKIRNLYVKLHPNSFSEAFPYDAFIDDWDDGEFY